MRSEGGTTDRIKSLDSGGCSVGKHGYAGTQVQGSRHTAVLLPNSACSFLGCVVRMLQPYICARAVIGPVVLPAWVGRSINKWSAGGSDYSAFEGGIPRLFRFLAGLPGLDGRLRSRVKLTFGEQGRRNGDGWVGLAAFAVVVDCWKEISASRSQRYRRLADMGFRQRPRSGPSPSAEALAVLAMTGASRTLRQLTAYA